jgi:hypothetical protein
VLRLLPLLLAGAAFAQQYDGPRPAKPDLPYLKHASNLVPTEVAEAKEDKQKNGILYIIAGAASSAKTPLALPIFIMKVDKVSAEKLQLYKLDVKSGHREIFFGSKKGQEALRMEVTKLSADGVYKIEVNDDLEPGEYTLTPEGSNQVFCFQVY